MFDKEFKFLKIKLNSLKFDMEDAIDTIRYKSDRLEGLEYHPPYSCNLLMLGHIESKGSVIMLTNRFWM